MVVEDAWNAVFGGVLARRGWAPRVVSYRGYGGTDFIRVLGRVLLSPPQDGAAERPDHTERRGWRNFFTAEAASVEVTVRIGKERYSVSSGRTGTIDARLPNPGLAPGWRRIGLRVGDGPESAARILIVRDRETFGIVSDLDDTVIRTYLPRPLLAAYHTFVLTEGARRPVPGMPTLYARLRAGHPHAPTVYVSTGAWNTAPTLTRFLSRYKFPSGPLLMTDWGPTHTGWFRSGPEHKRACLAQLAEDFPTISWVLVGDDGQHDPSLYADFARSHPDHVRAIAIRQLSPPEQVLAHSTPGERSGNSPDEVEGDAGAVEGWDHGLEIPVVRASDGAGLLAALRADGVISSRG